MQMKSHILLARPLSPPRSGCKRCTLLHPINLGSKSRLPKLFDIFGTLCICMCKYVCTYIYTQLRQVSFFLQESPLLYSSGKKMKVAGQFGGPSRQRQQPPLLNPEKWVGSRDKILCEPTRGKSLLESWGTTFLPDWQSTLIFVIFTSKSHQHYPH